MPSQVLIVPGWQGSGSEHWQSRWEARHGYKRVEQHDWMHPLRGDWTARLEEVVLASEAPVCLAAHSLGCILVAWWAAHSRNVNRVMGALLVAPPDVEREDNRHLLHGWAPIQLQPLPFKSLVVASSNDSFCDLERASHFAAAWGASVYHLGAKGHINTDSGLGDWDEGHALLLNLKHASC